jgi:hypothetical protein
MACAVSRVIVHELTHIVTQDAGHTKNRSTKGSCDAARSAFGCGRNCGSGHSRNTPASALPSSGRVNAGG